jgi:RNA polymerase sigma factor (sigma-70 family)
MASHPLLDFIRRLRRARSVAEGDHLSDAQLLQRFAQQRDEAAFEVLVWRHGTMVLNVSQRLLRHSVDAEDVFQATFLTLARKASAIRRGTSVGSWLYKVAYRLALRARQTAARRQRYEQLGNETASAPLASDDAEVSAVLAQEVDRLPERYRAVVVLCYLQGATTEEASHLLGCPRGTVLSRLASARQRLRQRLVRRGIAPAAALAAVSFGETASATPAVALVACVVRAALPFAGGGAAIPIVSPQAAALAEGALQMMMWNKIKIVAAIVCVIALVGTGSGWLTRGRNAVEMSLPAAEPPAKKEGLPEAADPAKRFLKAIDDIHVRSAKHAELEEDEESDFFRQEMELRSKLVEAQDELRFQEREWDFERQQEQERIKTVSTRIARLEDQIREIILKEKAVKKPGELGSWAKSEKIELADLKDHLADLIEQRRARENNRHQVFRALREKAWKWESEQRRIESRHERKREVLAIRRQALLARLQALEELSAGLEPTGPLRDVERKLDALRREVGELRRALERQGKDVQKKSE